MTKTITPDNGNAKRTANYVFLKNGDITVSDIQRISMLTNSGKLVWRHSAESHAFYATPADGKSRDDPEISSKTIGGNIRGARIGYNPSTGMWHYFRLTDHSEQMHYVEEGSKPELMKGVNKLYNDIRTQHKNGTLRADR